LTDEHKNLSIVNNTTILKLVARTGNFIPTPSANQIVFNVRRSLNIFCIRVYKCITKSVYWNLITQGAEEARSAGLTRWRPRVFHHSDAVLKKQRDFFFSEANNTWRNNRGRFPALRSTLAIFESETLKKAEAISKSLHGCKWQNLSVPERLAIRELRSESCPYDDPTEYLSRHPSCNRFRPGIIRVTAWTQVWIAGSRPGPWIRLA
jgi:hypothetical protein